jgi:hypothetical protein
MSCHPRLKWQSVADYQIFRRGAQGESPVPGCCYELTPGLPCEHRWFVSWWTAGGSNPRPPDCEGVSEHILGLIQDASGRARKFHNSHSAAPLLVEIGSSICSRRFRKTPQASIVLDKN